jgi:hypothetical protein
VEVLRPSDPRLARRALPWRGEDVAGMVGSWCTHTATPGHGVLHWATLHARRLHRWDKHARRDLGSSDKQERRNTHQFHTISRQPYA